MADSGASTYYFDDTIIRDFKHRLKVYVHLATRRKRIPAGGALLDGTEEGVLQELVADDYDNQFLVRVDIVAAPGTGCNLFSVMTGAKTNIVILLRLRKPLSRGIRRHRAATKQTQRPLLARAGLEYGRI